MAFTPERLAATSEPPRREIDLRDLVEIWYRRRAVFLSIVVCAVVGMEIVNWVVYPTYESTVKLLIEGPAGFEVPFSRDKLVFKKSEITQTQSELLVSQPNLAEVVRALKLDERPAHGSGLRGRVHEFKDSCLRSLRDGKQRVKEFVVVDIFGGTCQPPREPSAYYRAIAHLQESAVLDVAPLSNTDVLVLSVRDRDPKWAAKIANYLSKTFAANELEARRERARAIHDSIAGRLDVINPAMTASRLAIAEFKEKNHIVDIEGQIAAAITDLSTLEMEYWDLSQKESVRELATWEALHRNAAGNRDIESRERIALMEKLAALAELETTYQSDHPKVVAARAAVAGIRGQLRERLPDATTDLPQNTGTALKDALLAKIQQVHGHLAELSRLDTRFQELLWDHEHTREVLKFLNRKREDASIAEHTTQTQVRIIEPAIPQFTPVKPRKWLNRGLAFLTALAVGVGLSALFEYMDRSIRTPESVTRLVGLKTLGSIPYAAR